MISMTVSCQAGARAFKPLNGKLRGPSGVMCGNTEKSIRVRPTARFSVRLKQSKIFACSSTAAVGF